MMTEKAARIAELEREIVEWEKEALAANKDGDAYIAEENLTHLRAELTRLRNDTPAITQGEGSEPVGWQFREKASNINHWIPGPWITVEDKPSINDLHELRPLYASPPPLPAGADPRVREALETLRGHARIAKDAYADQGGKLFSGFDIAETLRGLLRDIDACEAALRSPQSQGLVEAADAAIENIENVIDYPAAILEIIRDYRSRASDRSAYDGGA